MDPNAQPSTSASNPPPRRSEGSIDEQLQRLQQQIQEVTRQNLYLHDQLKKQKEESHPRPEFRERNHEIQLKLPDNFTGLERSKSRAFINQIKLHIALHPQRFPDDFSKVGFLGSLLSDQAANWFAPLLDNTTDNEREKARKEHLLHNWTDCLELFTSSYGDLDRARTAATKLRALR